MLRIHAIGGFRVEVGDEDRTPAAFDRAAALLAWLALNPGLHPRSAVAAQFWPDVLDESARASLRSALWALRRQLGEEANGALVATRDRVGLGDDVWVDVGEAERLRAAGQLEEALALAEGELLPGFEDEWTFEARDEHRTRTAAVLEQLAAAAEQAGDLRRAADLSRRAAALEPLSEEAHRSLMLRLAAAGDRAAALTTFAELRTRLLQTLRVGPSEETRLIAESLRSDAPAERVPAQLRRIDTQLFVGRTQELGRLAHLRDRHGEGVGIGLIAGEAGSGKTRLAARFAVDSATLGATVLYGSCGEEALVPYEPFADMVGENGLDATALEERLAGVPGERLYLVLEDLQWADRATLALLGRLVRGNLAERLFVVGTYREDEAQEPLFAAFADLRRSCAVERIELGGLNVEEMAALIGGAFETSAAAAQARAIHARTGGNPFYARELARHVAEQPRTSFGDVPQGIRDVVRARVDRLSEDCASVLAAAAVLGEAFELPELKVVSGRDEEVLETALDDAAAAGLIEETGAGSHRFAHALTRDAVYAGLGAGRRARLHRSAADALAARYGLDPGPRLAEIAMHRCEGAADGTDVETAVELAERAATHALDGLAYEQAVALLTRALKLLTDADVERRRRLTRSRAVAFARLTHAMVDVSG
jgi:DNA-binding SARP family transcriptional activator